MPCNSSSLCFSATLEYRCIYWHKMVTQLTEKKTDMTSIMVYIKLMNYLLILLIIAQACPIKCPVKLILLWPITDPTRHSRFTGATNN